MKITESKLRKMIRGVIREFTSGATAAGAKRGDYESPDTKSKQKAYTTKKSDYTTKKSDYDTKKAGVDDTRRYKSTPGRGVKGSAQYSSVDTGMRSAGFSAWATNPEWTTQKTSRDKAEIDKDSAESERDSALTAWNTSKSSDVKQTKATKKIGAAMGGKAAGGKGKGGKKGKKKT